MSCHIGDAAGLGNQCKKGIIKDGMVYAGLQRSQDLNKKSWLRRATPYASKQVELGDAKEIFIHS